MSSDMIKSIKTEYKIQENDVRKYFFNSDSCFTSTVESINIKSINPSIDDPFARFNVKNTELLFICEDKFIDDKYILQDDIEKIEVLTKDESIKKYGCKGLNTIIRIILKRGRSIQKKPIGGFVIVHGIR